MLKQNSFNPLSKRFGSEWVYFLIVIICLTINILAGLYVIKDFQNNTKQQINTLQDLGQKTSASLDHELLVQKVKLEILGAEVDSVLNHEKIVLGMSVIDLAPTENSSGYYLPIPNGKTENQVGHLTGLGEIPTPGTPVAEEIGMALSLSSLFEQAIKDKTYLPWVYYTSINQFMYIVPRINPDEFTFNNDLYQKEFFTIATPVNNPQRRIKWSPLYNDAAGAGMMVTISKPVYRDDNFLGVLSIDLSLSSLNWLLKNTVSTDINVFLVDASGNIIAGEGTLPFKIEPGSIEPEKVTSIDKNRVMVFPLSEAMWYVVVNIDQKQFNASVFEESSHMITIFLFILFTSILIMVTTINMRSARYMATHDTLTGALNRRAYDSFMISTMKKNAQAPQLIGLAICDIDLFKRYNDHYGHIAGDNVLRRVANALSTGLRNSTDRVFRVGGEEFAIVIFLNSNEDLSPILSRLVEEVSNLGIPHERSPFGHITISIGGVVTDLGTLKQLEDAYKLADDALYEAKDLGRNQWKIEELTLRV